MFRQRIRVIVSYYLLDGIPILWERGRELEGGAARGLIFQAKEIYSHDTVGLTVREVEDELTRYFLSGGYTRGLTQALQEAGYDPHDRYYEGGEACMYFSRGRCRLDIFYSGALPYREPLEV